MDPSSASTQAVQDTDDYLSFDPRAGRSARPTAGGNASRGRQTYADAIVFVVGGGSYVEFTNLGEYAARASGGGSSVVQAGGGTANGAGGSGRRITYGATEIVSPGDFLKSLGALARAG